jgi:hypothetical protein
MSTDLQQLLDDFKGALAELVECEDPTAEDLASLAFGGCALEFVMRGLNDEDTSDVRELLSQVRPILEAAQAAQEVNQQVVN